MYRRALLLFILAAVFNSAYDQESDSARKSIHQLESEYYGTLKKTTTDNFFKDYMFPATLESNPGRNLSKRVLGYVFILVITPLVLVTASPIKILLF